MAVSHPSWIYWAAGFPAICLNAVDPDALYTVTNLSIGDHFPTNVQGLTGWSVQYRLASRQDGWVGSLRDHCEYGIDERRLDRGE